MVGGVAGVVKLHNFLFIYKHFDVNFHICIST
jgi:hypothetical protein